MRFRVLLNAMAIVAVCLFVCPGLARADFEYRLVTTYNGAPPTTGVPWGRALFEDDGNDVVVTMTNLDVPKIQDWAFNIISSQESSLSHMAINWMSGPYDPKDNNANASGVALDDKNGIGGGALGHGFDFKFHFGSSQLGIGESAKFRLSAEDGGNVLDLDAAFFKGAKNASGYETSAHLTGYYVDGVGSSSAATGTTFAPVPEPSSIALWSILGLCGLGIVVRRRKS